MTEYIGSKSLFTTMLRNAMKRMVRDGPARIPNLSKISKTNSKTNNPR